MKVDNKLTGEADSKLAVELNFNHIDDFRAVEGRRPDPALKELKDMRGPADEPPVEDGGQTTSSKGWLADILANTEKAAAMAQGNGASRRRSNMSC